MLKLDVIVIGGVNYTYESEIGFEFISYNEIYFL